ncbi:MAG: YjjG family noncanonical pyrimidine nucleotidase [Ruminiclostridium sp.]|nr:YjjG family noncanonical pyrimidine nucleotidase [Ruminiclostridium sp.]
MHRNLLFDLDQTLLDFHASERIALKLVMEMNGLGFAEKNYDFFRQNNKNLWLEFEKGIISRTELFEQRFRRLFEECGCDPGRIDLIKANNDFIDLMSRNGVPMKGVTDFLKKARNDIPDARIYVVTNGVTRNAVGRICSTGLDEYITEVFVSENIGVSKPAKEYFDFVTKVIGDPIGSYIVIGDSLTSDMLGARNSNLTSCWFMPDGDPERAMKEYKISYSASSFDELFDVLIRWSSLPVIRETGE